MNWIWIVCSTAMAPKNGRKNEPPKQVKREMGVKDFFDTVYPSNARWITMGGFAFLCVVLIVVSCILYNKEVNVDYKSLEDQFDKLRTSLAVVRHHDELHRATPPKTAEEVGKLKSYIEEQQNLLAKRKGEYKHLYTIGTRSHRSWSAHGKSIYYLSKGKKNWYDAEKFCMSRDSHLISILSEEEQTFISSKIKHPIWIGLADEKEKGMWEWTDSSRFRKQYWSNNKPSRAPYNMEIEQHCTSLSPSASIYNWHQADCYIQKRWACKRTLEFQDD